MLRITRRDFLKYCAVSAGALGLSASTMMKLENAMALEAANGGIPVLWLDGAACTGCAMTLLNSKFYATVEDLLLNTLDLDYQKTIMSTAGAYIDDVPYTGANSISQAHTTYGAGGYVLVVEGAIQAAKPLNGDQGEFCKVGDLTLSNTETMIANVRKLAANAVAVLAVGTCASFGGIPAARGNVTDARGVLYRGNSRISTSITGAGNKGALNDPAFDGVGGVSNAQLRTVPVVNISGCPPHPDWIVGTIAHIVSTLGVDPASAIPPFTSYHRPVDYGYREYNCNAGPCPWRYNNTYLRGSTLEGDYNRRYPLGDSRALGREKYSNTNTGGCLGILGCKGRKTKADCSKRRWNTDIAEEYGVNWCVGSRGGCQGCTEPTFPDKVGKFYTFA